MEISVNLSGAESPTGSTTSTASESSRKRERGNEGDDGDEHDLLNKRNNRVTILKSRKPAKVRLNRTKDLAQEKAERKSSVSALEARVNQLCTAENANALRNQRVRTSLRNELSITGLTLGPVIEAALIQVTSAVAAVLKINVLSEESTTARLRRERQSTTVTDLPEPPRREPVTTRTTFAVDCSKPSTLSRMLAEKRSFGSLKYSQLDKALLTHPDIVTGHPGDRVINVNELLPLNVLNLLNDTKTQLKPSGFKYVWSRDLTVYAKFTNDSLVQIVNSPADITKLVQLYQHQSPKSSRQ